MTSIVRALVVVLAALGAVGGYVLVGWLDFYGPGTPSWVSGVVGVLATVLGVGVALRVGRHPATAVVLLLVLPFCGFFIHNAAEDRVLAVRGVSAECRVDDVQRSSRTVLNGGVEGGTSTVVRNVHRVRCPAGGPAELRTESAAVRAGGALRVTWDPRRRVEARPARDVPGGSALVLPSVAVLAVLLLAATADPAAFRRR
ncbi:hypothetical protein ACQEU3_16880 [Spirillospora sp. CA-253888]